MYIYRFPRTYCALVLVHDKSSLILLMILFHYTMSKGLGVFERVHLIVDANLLDGY